MSGRDMLRSQALPHITQQNMLNMNQQFLPPQQQSPPQPQSSAMGMLPNANSNMAFLHPSTHSPNNGAQYQMMAQQEQRRQQIMAQAQNAQVARPQTGGPPALNGLTSGQMQGVGYPNIPQQGGLRRVASHPGPPAHGSPMGVLQPGPPGMPGVVGAPGLGITVPGSMPGQMRPNPQQQMTMRQGQQPQQQNMGGQGSPPLALTRSGQLQGMPGMQPGMARSAVSAGMMGGMPQQLPGMAHTAGMPPSHSQNPFPPSMSQQSMGSSPSQPSMSQNQFSSATSIGHMQNAVDRARSANMSADFMAFNGQFPPQGPPHPASRTPSNNPTQYGFAPSSTPPNQHVDMSQALSAGGPSNGPPGPSNLTGFTMTPAQQFEQMQPGGGNSAGSRPEGFAPQFTMPPRPPSSQHSSLGHPSQQQHQPPHPQPSHPQPPPQSQPHQPHHMSPQHQHNQANGQVVHPARPQSQPQPPGRPPSQQAAPSRTPLPPNATLPANATLLRATSISMPPQPQPLLPHPGSSTPLSAPAGGQPSSGPPGMAQVNGGRAPGPQPAANAPSDSMISRIPPAPPTNGRPNTAPVVGTGQALGRLLQLSGVLASEHAKKLQLSHWEELVNDYFLSTSTLKLTLWKDNQKNEAKVFEVGTPILPRFFLVTSQSGVKSMTLSMDGARERLFSHNHAVVECVAAVWTYRYSNGYTVTLRGPLTAHVVAINTPPANGAPAQSASLPGFALKISNLQFDSNVYEKHISLDAILGQRVDSPKTPRQRNAQTPTLNGVSATQQKAEEERWEEPRIVYERATIPSEPVNAFGIPQATMRCLELAESVAQMSDLIQFSARTDCGPLDSLKQFAQHLRENPLPGMTVPGPIPNGGSYHPDGMSSLAPNSSSHSLYPSTPITSSASVPSGGQSSLSQQGGPPSATGSPGKMKGTPQQSHAPNPSSTANTPSQPSNPSSTPSLANATLKRKAASSETASPTTSVDQSQPGKRNPRKRGRTTGAG
ncbi:hypothetical protein FA95DRAFT_1553277 [Auriscalpium vulgare]|uniref:Uncharacterized protein n=1 Tax=Auriscalpium vulgare TaxID=40419 RepID=A0ACB8S9X5_9AGAM|nr:hypothetical protein FA95DRAFT_1553277 [Auriscalpium vulgare]